MISRVITLVLFAIIAITFIVIPYFNELTLFKYILVLFMIVFNSYWTGYYLADVRGEWRRMEKDRRAKRFYWYRNMGLFESAYLVEPKLAKRYWK